MLDQINKTDKNALNEYLVFEKDPEEIDIYTGDEICISNTFFSLLFTILTFSSACSVIVACQILNDQNKEQLKKIKAKNDAPSLLSNDEDDIHEEVELTEAPKSQSGL